MRDSPKSCCGYGGGCYKTSCCNTWTMFILVMLIQERYTTRRQVKVIPKKKIKTIRTISLGRDFKVKSHKKLKNSGLLAWLVGCQNVKLASKRRFVRHSHFPPITLCFTSSTCRSLRSLTCRSLRFLSFRSIVESRGIFRAGDSDKEILKHNRKLA